MPARMILPHTLTAVQWHDERCGAAAGKEALAALPDAAPDERRAAGSGGGGSTADASDASSDQFSGAPAAAPQACLMCAVLTFEATPLKVPDLDVWVFVCMLTGHSRREVHAAYSDSPSQQIG